MNHILVGCRYCSRQVAGRRRLLHPMAGKVYMPMPCAQAVASCMGCKHAGGNSNRDTFTAVPWICASGAEPMPPCFILKGTFDPARPERPPDFVLTEEFQDLIKGDLSHVVLHAARVSVHDERDLHVHLRAQVSAIHGALAQERPHLPDDGLLRSARPVRGALDRTSLLLTSASLTLCVHAAVQFVCDAAHV